jgi:antibiotic biosynthesis monooxygenase (ABM) superfamily enzyme
MWNEVGDKLKRKVFLEWDDEMRAWTVRKYEGFEHVSIIRADLRNDDIWYIITKKKKVKK